MTLLDIENINIDSVLFKVVLFKKATLIKLQLSILIRDYSYLPNKRAGPNKRVGWKICQNQKINRIGLNNRVGWKNAKNSG